MYSNGFVNPQNFDFVLNVATRVLETLDMPGQNPNEEEKHEELVQSDSDESEYNHFLAKFLSNDSDEGVSSTPSIANSF